MAASMVLKCRLALQTFETRLLQIFGSQGPFGGGQPALVGAFDVGPACDNQVQDAKSVLDSILDGFMWAAVPKRRRSREKRTRRKLGTAFVREWMTPRTNIISCLECGHYHQRGNLCPNCYEKVREETEAMRAKMNEDDRLFNYPQKEVKFVYEEEGNVKDRPMYKGKYIVEMEKPRPEWWPRNMLTKGHRS